MAEGKAFKVPNYFGVYKLLFKNDLYLKPKWRLLWTALEIKFFKGEKKRFHQTLWVAML